MYVQNDGVRVKMSTFTFELLFNLICSNCRAMYICSVKTTIVWQFKVCIMFVMLQDFMQIK